MVSEIETISPLDDPEVIEVCRVSNRLVAECACGCVMRGGVHLCHIAKAGFLCGDCCPSCSGRVALTGAELAAIEANRRRCHKDDCPVAVNPSKVNWTERRTDLVVMRLKPPHFGNRLIAYNLIQDGMGYPEAREALTMRGLPKPKDILWILSKLGSIKITTVG